MHVACQITDSVEEPASSRMANHVLQFARRMFRLWENPGLGEFRIPGSGRLRRYGHAKASTVNRWSESS